MILPNLLVEMFFTSIGMQMILLMVMRPEESMDANVGTLSWKAYQADLKNILLSGQRVQILVLNQANAGEMRSYLGEDDFYALISTVKDEVIRFFQEHRAAADVYYEGPGHIYLILPDAKLDTARLAPRLVESIGERAKAYSDRGVRLSPKVCVIRLPEDLRDFQEIVNLGHRFPQLGEHDQVVFPASEIVRSRDYTITNHMEQILNRAIRAHSIEMYYQPIYSVREGRFCSAEALARLIDSEYGMISPAVFITAAEKTGLMLPIGEIVMESVFRFISQYDLDALGLSYIEINLSVAQCLQADLPQVVRRLQDRYGVEPRKVVFEITETMFDNLNGVMDRNLRALTEMGYSFALDDYGVGYSNIQRLRTLPLKIIKIDKSMVDDMNTRDGAVIIESTVHMMKGIRKELVVEGVETKEATAAFSDLSCDFIQGYYFSKPLPAEDFVRFVQARNGLA